MKKWQWQALGATLLTLLVVALVAREPKVDGEHLTSAETDDRFSFYGGQQTTGHVHSITPFPSDEPMTYIVEVRPAWNSDASLRTAFSAELLAKDDKVVVRTIRKQNMGFGGHPEYTSFATRVK